MGLIIGGVSPQDLIMDGHSVSLYVGGNPPTKVWPTGPVTVQITLGSGYQARDQFRAALTERGLNYATVTEVPFEIELVGTGSMTDMFRDCSSLTSVPSMDTSQVTNMYAMFNGCSALVSVPEMDTAQVANMQAMFYNCPALTSVPEMDTSRVTNMQAMFFGCSSLTSVPDLDTAQVTNTRFMFQNCAALTDGNVRLIGKHPNVTTTGMITGSGLTREPFHVTTEVHEVTLTDVIGEGAVHPLLTVTVPAGETWQVRIQGTITKGTNVAYAQSFFRIGVTDSGRYGSGAAVDFSGTVTAANSTIAMVTNHISATASFTGTVTIEK